MSSNTGYQHINYSLANDLAETIVRLGITSPWEVNDKEVNNFFITHGYANVILVGSNPSNKSPDCSAFHPATKSRKFVDKWFEDKKVNITYMNLVDHKTEKNKQLKVSQIRAELDNIKDKFRNKKYIVACGKIAAKGLTMAGIEHFEMPHPSGLCRFWNDEEAGKEKVKEMLAWLKK